MKKKNYLEIVGVLSISLILTSAMSVSSCLPEMLRTFPTYSRASMELLISVPAFAMMLIIASSPYLSKFLNERVMVITGLLIYSIAGIFPAFTTSYTLILAMRICMGIGIGLVNTRAVSMIGERFTGNLQQRLQGIRCSVETLGQATLTMLAGQLLRFNWHYSFYVYTIGFVILLVYLKFVPSQNTVSSYAKREKSSNRITQKEWLIIFQNCLLGAMHISASVVISLRLTSYVIEYGLGTDVNGATILSISTLVGFLGGLAFGTLIKTLRSYMLPFTMSMTAIGMLLIVHSKSLALVSVGASISTFFITNGVSYLFNRLSSRLSKAALYTGNSIVLVGCNMGSFTAPFILRIIQVINPELKFGFFAYAILFFLAASFILLRNILTTKSSRH